MIESDETADHLPSVTRFLALSGETFQVNPRFAETAFFLALPAENLRLTTRFLSASLR
jgi:hypothetical protein